MHKLAELKYVLKYVHHSKTLGHPETSEGAVAADKVTKKRMKIRGYNANFIRERKVALKHAQRVNDYNDMLQPHDAAF